MFDLRLGGVGALASASFLLAAPAWPDGCASPDPGPGGAAGVGGVPDTCGNGVLDDYEMCEGQQFAGGFAPCAFPSYLGAVTCNSQCRIETFTCVQPVCGNNVAEKTETCDGSDMSRYTGPQQCSDIYFAHSILGVSTNYTGGVVKCTDCMFDWSECTIPPGCYHQGFGRAYLGVVCY